MRQEVAALSFQAAAREEEHKTQVHNLSAQLEKAGSETVRGLLKNNAVLHGCDEPTVIIVCTHTGQSK